MSAMYPLDHALAESLKYAPALDLSDIPATRAALAALMAGLPAYMPAAGVAVSNRVVSGLHNDVPVIVLSPENNDTSRPALLWFHGGGFVLGSASDGLPFLERLVLETGVVVVSVDYRLAPEARFPGALDDASAALAWLAENAPALGVDASRIAVGGQSAGGAIAAGLALRTRDERGPSIAFQLLDIPVIDDSQTHRSAYGPTHRPDRSVARTPRWQYR